MATKTIDIILDLQPAPGSVTRTEKGILKIQKGLQDIEKQANRTREKMEKLANVGNKLALVGGAIVAPFALAMKKYADNIKEQREGLYANVDARRKELETLLKSKDATKEQVQEARKQLKIAGESLIVFNKENEIQTRLADVTRRWNKSIVSIGKTTAEIIVPALEKAVVLAEKVAKFTEDNPDVIKVALGIGGTLVVLGGLLSTTAQIVSTIATVQGLAAGWTAANATTLAGISIGGAGAAGGASAGAIGAAVAGALAPVLVGAAALAIGAEVGRRLTNALLGTNTTWKDIGVTVKQLLFIAGEGWKMLPGFLANLFKDAFSNISQIVYKVGNNIISGIANFFKGLGQSIVNGFKSFGQGISDGFGKIASAIGGLLRGKQAAGGYANKSGLYMRGEAGKEFVINNSTTRAAESVIGGTLTQERLLQALAGGGRKVSYYDARRFDASVSANDRRMIANETILAITGAL